MRRSAACTIRASARDIIYELSRAGAARRAEQARGRPRTPPRRSTAISRRTPAYRALRKKLAEARGHKGDAGPAQIARGPVLEIASDKRTRQTVLMQDERVPLLRERLGLPAVRDDLFYDKPLADAVAQFQKEKGLPATGRLTQRRRVDALNGKRHERDDIIIMANMERWRWLPRDLGKAHVVLNIPDFTLRVYNNGAPVWTTRVVVGKPGTPTPLLSETMKYITVNPTWNVPPSIVYNEYLPALQQDPTVLKRMGLNLVQNRDGSVHISQPPGEANALGRIRFNFPNKFLVYQHDTPDKHLFAQTKRAYSHGCMRVQDPTKYAEVLLAIALPKEGYTREKIKSMYGRSEIDIRFPTPIPVHITYQTAFVDDAGQLQIREDLYGRDAAPARGPEGRGPPAGRNPGRAGAARTTAGRRCGCRRAMRTTAAGRAASRSSIGCSVTRYSRLQPAAASSAGPAGPPRVSSGIRRSVNHPGRLWRKRAIFRHTPPLAN